MKIIHKKKKKISSMQFSSPKQKYKKYSFFPPTLICRPQGKVFSAVR